MEVRHLRYFCVLAEQLHFTKAALLLRVAVECCAARTQPLDQATGGGARYATCRAEQPARWTEELLYNQRCGSRKALMGRWIWMLQTPRMIMIRALLTVLLITAGVKNAKLNAAGAEG